MGGGGGERGGEGGGGGGQEKVSARRVRLRSGSVARLGTYGCLD